MWEVPGTDHDGSADVIMIKRLEITGISRVKKDHDQEHLTQRQLARPPPTRNFAKKMMTLPIVVQFGEIIKTAIQSGDIKTHGDDLYGGCVNTIDSDML